MCSSEAPASRALVDDQVQVGGLGVGAHPHAPRGDGSSRSPPRRARRARSRARGCRRSPRELRPRAGERNRSACAPRAEAPSGSIAAEKPVSTAGLWPPPAACSAGPRSGPGTGSEPNAAASRARRAAVAGPVGPDLGRGALLAPLAERAPSAASGRTSTGAGANTSGRSARPGARIARRPVSWSIRTSGERFSAAEEAGRAAAGCRRAAGSPRAAGPRPGPSEAGARLRPALRRCREREARAAA